MPYKDPNCPACRGRSHDPSGCSDFYHVCQLCEEPDEAYVKRYRDQFPAHYQAWQQSRRLAEEVANHSRPMPCLACHHPLTFEDDECSNCGQEAVA